MGAFLRLLRGIATGVPCALQVAMFADRRKERELAAVIAEFKPDVVYLDGIRLVDYAPGIRVLIGRRPIIFDFDDLMSRRAAILHDARLPVSPGYLTKSIPGPLVRLANASFIRQTFLQYERYCLQRQERQAVEAAHAVTLVSTDDARALGALLDARAMRKIHVIAPPVTSTRPLTRPSDPLRFVFIGSDTQLQNRLSIDYLLGLWKRLEPRTPLVIYGRMVREYDAVPNVRFAGFAPSHDDVYTTSSIAMCPAFLGGGIKSKVLEAISHGCPPVGNATAYEGLGFHDDSLAMSEADLERFVTDPSQNLDAVLDAAATFASYCEAHYSVTAFATRWRNLLALSPAVQMQPASPPMPAHQPLHL
jgi:glycosyltransferase involved in cell wall biosynthesis